MKKRLKVIPMRLGYYKHARRYPKGHAKYAGPFYMDEEEFYRVDRDGKSHPCSWVVLADEYEEPEVEEYEDEVMAESDDVI
jgi:hypothetical protein